MASMKFFVLVTLATVALASHPDFDEFKQAFKKDYVSSLEMLQRRLIFEDNLRKIDTHNDLYAKGEVSYSMGVNQFTDMTEDEKSSMFHGLPRITEKMAQEFAAKSAVKPATRSPSPTSKMPRYFSWKDRGYVLTSVKNQGQCGSCAAFAATASVESCFNIKAGEMVIDDLSEQFLNDCGNGHVYKDEEAGGEWGASGCAGAWPQSYLDLIYSVYDGYQETEESYPYNGHDGNCNYNASGNFMSETVTGQEFYWQTQLDVEKELMQMIEQGPVATSFTVTENFFNYKKGVFYDKTCCSSATAACTDKNNHAVTITGYGTTGSGENYWEVKNSWGAGWGDNGYFKIQRGLAHCGFGAQMAARAQC